MKVDVSKVYHQSYSVKCECGYERFTTGNRARVVARNVARDHRTEHANGADTLDMSRCPACGSFTDHCQGHGEIGDPYGYRILMQHDEDNHAECVKYRGKCLGK